MSPEAHVCFLRFFWMGHVEVHVDGRSDWLEGHVDLLDLVRALHQEEERATLLVFIAGACLPESHPVAAVEDH